MAKKTIILGTSPNYGDGDPLRTAFGKINDNFDELYAGNFVDPLNTASSLIPGTDNTYDLGSSDNQWSDLYVADFIYLNGSRLEVDAQGKLRVDGEIQQVIDVTGSVFADDSTLLVDGVNGKIVGPVEPSYFKAPSLTQAQIDALTPKFGIIVYNSTTGKFQGYAADANNDSVADWADLH